MEVSVPSRGLSYLNENGCNHILQTASFRPLTGTLLSKAKSKLTNEWWYMFPSPHGDSLI